MRQIIHSPPMREREPADMSWFHHASIRRRYLVGVSGGADSVALLHLLHREKFRHLVICHLNHRLRGKASLADEQLVRKLAADLGYPCEIQRTSIATRAKKSGQSIETEAREARHEFFAACSRKWRCPRLLLAHHADDQAETVLWNLLRGSHGLRGIMPVRTLTMATRPIEVIRPLLKWRKSTLKSWLQTRDLIWREDQSNQTPCAIRNQLRHEVLPKLAEISGRDVTRTLAKALESTHELREIERWAVEHAQVIDPRGRLHLPKLKSLPTALQRACLHQFLCDHQIPDISRDTLDRALALLDPASGAKLSLPSGKCLRRRQGRLWIE